MRQHRPMLSLRRTEFLPHRHHRLLSRQPNRTPQQLSSLSTHCQELQVCPSVQCFTPSLLLALSEQHVVNRVVGLGIKHAAAVLLRSAPIAKVVRVLFCCLGLFFYVVAFIVMSHKFKRSCQPQLCPRSHPKPSLSSPFTSLLFFFFPNFLSCRGAVYSVMALPCHLCAHAHGVHAPKVPWVHLHQVAFALD